MTRSKDELIKLAVERLLRLLDYAPRDEAPEPAPRPEPEPRKLRQSEQPGVDMNDMKQQSLSHKLIACELERLGYLNARGECYSVESIKKIIRDAARSLELEAWPLSPG